MRSDGDYLHRLSESWTVIQLLDGASGEEFLDLKMPRHCLAHPSARVLIPICLPQWRMNTQPRAVSFRISSTRFTALGTRRLGARTESPAGDIGVDIPQLFLQFLGLSPVESASIA